MNIIEKMSHKELLHCCLTVHRLYNNNRKYSRGFINTTIIPISGWHIIQLITGKPYFSKVPRIYGAVFINNNDSAKCIVAYRGSIGLIEWMHNLNVRIGDHIGYDDLFSRFSPLEIPEDVSDISFTGISMGGAMAINAYNSYKDNKGKRLVTFGSPITKHSQFCYAVSTDPVPLLGTLFNISSSKTTTIRVRHWWQYLPYGGHSIEGYWTGVGASLSDFPVKCRMKWFGNLSINKVFLILVLQFLVLISSIVFLSVLIV